MSEKSIPNFCAEAKIKLEHVTKSYASFLRMMHGFILKSGYVIDEDLTVNRRLLKEAVIDFYNDIARIKAVHIIDEPSVEKDDAYKAYWLLRRKPIQIIKEFPDSEFINEAFIALYLLGLISKSIDKAKKASNSKWKEFRHLLFRNIKYRTITQQSLELMIEAFFCGCDFAVVPEKVNL
jgi:hypothetical protein